MLFDNPKWLWLLLAALLPLIIHLINKGNRSVVEVGSLEWLQQKDFKQTSKVKFQQFWLWLIRTLIFLLIAFIVAKPYLSKTEKIENRHLLLIKDDVPSEIISKVTDTISDNTWNIKWLDWELQTLDLKQKILPTIQAIHPYEAFDLINYLEINPLSLTVLGNFTEDQLKAKIPPTGFPVSWILLPHGNEYSSNKIATKKINDSKQTIQLEQKDFIAKLIVNDDENFNLPVVDFSLDTIVVGYDKNQDQLAKIVAIALKAITDYQQMEVKIIKELTENMNPNTKGDILFSLSESEIDKQFQQSFNKIFQYNLLLNHNTFQQISDAFTLFNLELSSNKIPELLNEMMFKNNEVDKKYNELVNLPTNKTFFDNFDNNKQTSGFINNTKRVDAMQFLVLSLLLLILVERLLCRFTEL